jgi:FkbM family methyltransferase
MTMSRMGSRKEGGVARMIRIARPVGTLIFLLAWLMPWRPAFRTRAKQSKLSFFVHRRDLIGRHIAKYGTHEPLLTQWISGYLARSSRGIFVDVGANLGWYAVHAAKHKSVDTVVAFEPDLFNAWLLGRNLSLNGIDNVVVSTCAVGAQRGLIRLHQYKDSNRGRHSVLADYGHGSRIVPMTDVDTELETLGLADHPVLIVKIDVEGYEPEVVVGAKRTLARADVVIVEYSPGLSRAGGLSHEDMLDQLYAAGLTPYSLGAREWTEESPVSSRPFEGQMDVIWIRAGKETSLLTDDGAYLTPLADKAALLQLAEIWTHLEAKAASQSLEVD